VVLEAMASALPVIATRWGGPADYLDDDCGILIEPTGRRFLVQELASAMTRLANDRPLRERLGANGRKKVEREYDWERKLDRMLEIYRSVQHAPAIAAISEVSVEQLIRLPNAAAPSNDVQEVAQAIEDRRAAG